MLKPAKLPCQHEFCCYCIRSIRYKHEEQLIVCPLCRKTADAAPLNKHREIQIVKALLDRKGWRVFWSKGSTINDYDQNLTESRGFFYIMKDDNLVGDIIWGGGSEHDSYVDEVARAQGKVQLS